LSINPDKIQDNRLFDSEEQISFRYALEAYRRGVRTLRISSAGSSTSEIRGDIRYFLIKRGLLIIRNLIGGNCVRMYRRAGQKVKDGRDYLRENLYRLEPPLLKHTCIKYFEHSYARKLNDFVNRQKLPVLDSSAYFNGTHVHYFIGSLGPGGAERQMVNVAAGVSSSMDVRVTCEHYASEAERHFAHVLEVSGVRIDALSLIDSAIATLHSLDNTRLSELLSDDYFDDKDGHYFGKSLIPYIAEIVTSRPAVVHAWLDSINVRAGLAAYLLGVPRIVLSQRSVAPDQFRFYTFEMLAVYRLLMSSDKVIVLNNSEAGKLDYCRWLKCRPESIRVIYNGIAFSKSTSDDINPLDFRDHYKIPHDAPLIGCIMRFSEEKRPLFWLAHARQVLVTHPETRFLLVGDGVMLEQARRYAASTGIQDSVIFTGILNSVEVAIKAMDVFVLSSRVEGLPNVLIEAQHLGVPVVTTDAGGAKETMLEGVTGYCILMATPEKMATAVCRIIDDADWRRNAAGVGPRFASDRFGQEEMTRTMISLYRE